MTSTAASALSVDQLFSMKGKVALVTGGSRGIGEMIAAGYLANGATVYISSRKADACDATAARLSETYGGTCVSLPADVSNLDGVTGLADALIVSGTGTGQTTSLTDVKRLRSACPEAPILIGSGATADAASYLEFADGLIVGTWVKRAGKISNPVDRNRVAALRKAIS